MLGARGYRPGALIERVRLDLSDFDCELIAPHRAEFSPPGADWRFSVQESLEPHFLMHIASAEFTCRCPFEPAAQDLSGAGAVTARHRGAIRRTGIEYRSSGSASAEIFGLRDKLNGDPELSGALMPLDFTKCRFTLGNGHVEMRVRHFGACEVVGQLPKFRRYVRLGGPQRDSLMNSFGAFRRLIQG